MEVLEYFQESTEIRVLHVGRSQGRITRILAYPHVSQCGNVECVRECNKKFNFFARLFNGYFCLEWIVKIVSVRDEILFVTVFSLGYLCGMLK